MTVRDIVEFLTVIISQLEGPYKWYVMGGAAFLISALITRFIFKSFKWMLLLILIAVLMFGGFWLLINLAIPG